MTAIALPHTTPVDDSREDLVRVYVWEWPVRASHWLIVLSILVLSATGIYIGHPFLTVTGPAREHFVMGWMRTIHLYTSIVFALAVFSRVLWMFLGNRYAKWDKFIPVAAKRWHGLWSTLRFYLFRMRKPPGFVGHNPLAGLVYSGVFLLYFVMIATGFALYSAYAPVGSPMRFFQFLIPWVGGLQIARTTHHITMWLLLAFMVHHVYSSALMSIIEANATLESIVTGFKFVPREDLIYSGYRFVERQEAVHGKS